jgi:hypothetical protein
MLTVVLNNRRFSSFINACQIRQAVSWVFATESTNRISTSFEAVMDGHTDGTTFEISYSSISMDNMTTFVHDLSNLVQLGVGEPSSPPASIYSPLY